MDFHAEAVIADEFMKFVMNGALYLGSKPVMWSPVEQTALAEAEIEYQDHQSPTIWVKFPVGRSKDSWSRDQRELTDSGTYSRARRVVIWTTTPWTIPSNRGVAYSGRSPTASIEVTAAPAGQLGEAGRTLVLADSSPTK